MTAEPKTEVDTPDPDSSPGVVESLFEGVLDPDGEADGPDAGEPEGPAEG